MAERLLGSILVFVCLGAMLLVLLGMPYAITWARRVPVLDQLLTRAAFYMGVLLDGPQQAQGQRAAGQELCQRLPTLSYGSKEWSAARAAGAGGSHTAGTGIATGCGSDPETCSVCLDDFAAGDIVSVLCCGHVFHRQCINTWLSRSATCPLCKLDLLQAAEGALGQGGARPSGAHAGSGSSHRSAEVGDIEAGASAEARPHCPAAPPPVAAPPAPALAGEGDLEAGAAAGRGVRGAASGLPAPAAPEPSALLPAQQQQ